MFRLFFSSLVILLSLATVCHAQTEKPRELSLNEAILLAVRENPNVQTSQLSYVQQKFALEIQQWQFQPHFAIQASKTTTQTYSVTPGGYVTTNATGIQPSVSLLTPLGTQVSLSASNSLSDHYNPGLSLQVMQPLMRGFGRPIVEAALYNARDSEKISRLGVEGTLRSTITSVINAYLDVISAKNTLKIDQEALNRSEESVRQTKLFIKAGHKAGVELVAVQADAASAEARIENDKNNLDQARYALLSTIGIDPSTNVGVSSVDVTKLIKKYQIPTLDEAKEMILENDIQYQTDQITLHGSVQRSVLQAEDNTRWQLNLTANANAGNSTGGGPNAGLNSLVNGVNQTDSATLNLTIPIDDRPAKLALASAKIALREAEIALKQEKWGKETSVINGWNTIYSAERAEQFAENAERLQEQTYKVSFQKYSFGLIDSLELQTAQQQFSAAQQALLGARVSYLKALINLDLLVGTTLKTWDIKIKL
ncbi:MAG: TolC family protein [Gammaproteobacteria bacterium]